jgi:hypothetical protein
MYIKTMGGEKIPLTEDQSVKLKVLLTTSAPKFFLLGNNLINVSTVAGLFEDELAKNEVKQLKDGTLAIQKFGLWYDANNPDVKLDLAYYPELKPQYGNTVPSDSARLSDGQRWGIEGDTEHSLGRIGQGEPVGLADPEALESDG